MSEYEKKDPIGDMLREVSQDVAYKLGDLVMSYPPQFAPIVLATINMCVQAELPCMSPDGRDVYKMFQERSTIMTLPRNMDPRKRG